MEPSPTICPPLVCHAYVSADPEGSFTLALIVARSPASTVAGFAVQLIVGAAGFGRTVTFAEQLELVPAPLSTRAVSTYPPGPAPDESQRTNCPTPLIFPPVAVHT